MNIIKKQRQELSAEELSNFMELMIQASIAGIRDDEAERPSLVRWVYNCPNPNEAADITFEEVCRAVPYDPDRIRDSLEHIMGKEIAEYTGGRYGTGA